MPSLTSVIATGIGAIVLLPVLALAGIGAAGPCSATPGVTSQSGQGQNGLTVWDAEQEKNAQVIIQTGVGLGVNGRAIVIAVATAIQESSLRNISHGDRIGPDSLGLFQQRASWGTPAERMDPAAATHLFLTGGRGGQPGLMDIPGWQQMPLSQAAQAVQRSAYPDAYAAHENDAVALVARFAGATTLAGTCVDAIPSRTGSGVPEDYVVPALASSAARKAIVWALQQVGTPYAHGDCTDAHSGDPARQCDCSSLVQQAYRAAGIALPRTTLNQVGSGTSVPANELAAGDLIFVPGSEGTMSVPRHVGLYLGRGLIVHAPQPGRDVEITELAGWQDQIASIRRPT